MATLETISSIDTAPRHPIRLVANRTGLTVDLIRAWEKRYHVVEPARSDTKRRLYSDYDIERLRLIRIAKQNGRRLVDVAPMSLEALRDVVSEDSRFDAAKDNQAEVYRPSWSNPLESTDTQDAVDAMLFAIQTMDQHRFDHLLQEGLVKQALPVYLETVIGPLLREIGESTRLREASDRTRAYGNCALEDVYWGPPISRNLHRQRTEDRDYHTNRTAS